MNAPPPRRSAIGQRWKPALVLLLGFLLLAVNALIVAGSGRFLLIMLYGSCAMVFAGAFGAVVGEPEDAYGNRPMWFKAGIVGSIVVGLLAALVLNIELTVE
jgi:hypothetical protein